MEWSPSDLAPVRAEDAVSVQVPAGLTNGKGEVIGSRSGVLHCKGGPSVLPGEEGTELAAQNRRVWQRPWIKLCAAREASVFQGICESQPRGRIRSVLRMSFLPSSPSFLLLSLPSFPFPSPLHSLSLPSATVY